MVLLVCYGEGVCFSSLVISLSCVYGFASLAVSADNNQNVILYILGNWLQIILSFHTFTALKLLLARV